jgi:hypothetical protein
MVPDDRSRLRVSVPAQLPLVPPHTQTIGPLAGSGRLWLAPGIAGADHQAAACVFWQANRRASASAACFDLATVRRRRALQMFGGRGQVLLVGVVPAGTSRATVTLRTGGTVRVPVVGNTYYADLPALPSRVRITAHSRPAVSIRLE